MNPLSRVPYFNFVDREFGINAEASAELGYEVPKLVTFILIVPHGHRGDPQEFIADEYIPRKQDEARNGRYDPLWVEEYKRGLALYREGKELPRSGTPLMTWERILKSRREILSKQYPTVEDLAAVPDAALFNIGLDGRVLRDLAIGDIKAKTDLSPVVKELANANETIRQQAEQLASLNKRLEALVL